MAGQPKPFRPAEEHQSAVLHSSAKGKFEEIGFLYSRLFSHLCYILSTVHLFIVIFVAFSPSLSSPTSIALRM